MQNSVVLVAVVWQEAPESVTVRVRHGGPVELSVPGGKGEVDNETVQGLPEGPGRLRVACCAAHAGPGSPSTVLTLEMPRGTFSFYLRDVTASCPVYVPEFGTAVVPADDGRSYQEMARAVEQKGGLTKLERIEREPEETFENAAAHTRRVECPTILGLGRDIRLFEVDHRFLRPQNPAPRVNQVESAVTITPRFHSTPGRIKETDFNDLTYSLFMTRGVGCAMPSVRRLEDGDLPILHLRLEDEDVLYDARFFCGLEQEPLGPGRVRGTHYQVAHGWSGGHFFTESQADEFQALLAEETSRSAEETLGHLESLRRADGTAPYGYEFTEEGRARFDKRRGEAGAAEEETVLYGRVNIVNNAAAPRYAWLKTPGPAGAAGQYEPETGFCVLPSGRVGCVSRLNGEPPPHWEICLLLQPGRRATVDFAIPHTPVARPRAERLAAQSQPDHHAACKRYWRDKLDKAASIELPEPRIADMLKAGLLHLDVVTYGREPRGALAPSCGLYTALGRESASMIQFMDSMGRHDEAGRCLDFFLERQDERGAMRNYDGHEADAGPVLWTCAEHVRYTGDRAWLQDRLTRILKTCDFVLKWRDRNRCEDYRDGGYGMCDGQLADMKEVYHSYILNACLYQGVAAVADVLEEVAAGESKRLQAEAEAWKRDIGDAVTRSLERSPVVPLGDGTWTPSLPPWPEVDEPACLDGTRGALTHGSFLIRDNCVPTALIVAGLLDWADPRAVRLMQLVSDIYHVRNVRHSQPLISRHPWVHLQRGEAKPFLKAFYNSMASLADRETYTFWEHFHGVQPHKTEGESGWLMLARWMLWLEQGETLFLLRGIPRAWLSHGASIRLKDVVSYFGPVTLNVVSQVDKGEIRAAYALCKDRLPDRLALRLPHPGSLQPYRVQGGNYREDDATVWIDKPATEGEVVLQY